MSQFRLKNSSVTLLNRGGVKFFGQKKGNDVIFDTENYSDPRLEFTTSKLAEGLSEEQVAAAIDEVVETLTNMGAEKIEVESQKAKAQAPKATAQAE